ncbi:MAG TPA: hypothetical protein VGF96_18435 [Terracidiphilus sp.]|jgi:hypothetical protein
MQEHTTEQELNDRLCLIENMIAEGRRKCESWGWTFVLWGVAYYIAFFWSGWTHFAYAWPVTVVIAGLITMAGFWRKGDSAPNTTIGRAIASIWIATGISMFVLFDALGFSGRLTDGQIFIAAASAMLGTANAACSMALKWKVEFGCAIVWWATAVVASFGTPNDSTIAFLVAIFLCQIVFGTYMMILESRQRRQVASHA